MKLARKNFLDLKKHCDLQRARYVVIPFGFEASTTFEKGTHKGPGAIISASAEVELFDEELGYEPYSRFGIATLQPPLVSKNRHLAFQHLEKIVQEIVAMKKIPIVFGGEHTITLPPILALNKNYRDIAVLHFDAHSDLRPFYQNNPYSHASAMHLILPHISHLVSLGVRNFSQDEVPVLEKNKNKIKIFWAREFKKQGVRAAFKKILPLLASRDVYLSFDVDVFDLSLIGSSTGTPEPGGLTYGEIVDCFRAILPKVNLIGADFVELKPIKNFHAPDFLAAKTIYKALTHASLKLI